MNALLDEDKKYIATATAGVLFLGTPHRGSKDASWARVITNVGKQFGLGSHNGIIEELEKASENQMDRLHHFTCWLRRMSVEIVCFFELKETDYGRKVGLPGVHREIVSCDFYGGRIY